MPIDSATSSDTASIRCVARCTSDDASSSVADTQPNLDFQHHGQVKRECRSEDIFRAARFSADGTTIIAQNGPRLLQSFVLPADMLERNTGSPRRLSEHLSILAPTPIRSYAIYPGFALADASLTTVLSSPKDLPITLQNAVYGEGVIHAQYPLISPTTEEYRAPASLLWIRQGSHFIAGGDSQLAVFDASRNNEGPIVDRKRPRGNGHSYDSANSIHCRGLVNALCVNCDGILTAGTTNRHVTMVSNEGLGEHISSFYLPKDGTAGTGITQLAASSCGTFLFIAERQCDFIQVYDIRNTHMRLACLSDRGAFSTLPMEMDVISSKTGSQVWAGDSDGSVRAWNSVGSTEGHQAPDTQFRIHDGKNGSLFASGNYEMQLTHESILGLTTSISWHPFVNVFATCTGQDKYRLAQDFQAKGSDESCLAGQDDSANPQRMNSGSMLQVWAS